MVPSTSVQRGLRAARPRHTMDRLTTEPSLSPLQKPPFLTALSLTLLILAAVLILPALAAYGTWSHTGSVSFDRSGHTATLLNNGKFLLSGGEGGMTSAQLFKLSLPSNLTLNQALDNNTLSFSVGGNASWFPETGIWLYAGSAAQSGAITDNQTSGLQTTVVGPGVLSFYFKVSSETYYDWLNWYLDRNLIEGWSGDKDWNITTITIPAGSHSVKWVYEKDDSVTVGSDCGWVDKVVFSRGKVFTVLLLLLD